MLIYKKIVMMDLDLDGGVINNGTWKFIGKVDYVDQWFLMKTPVPLLCLTACYLLFVLKLGPKYMRKRRPFQLKTVIISYNIVQVLYSCILLVIGSRIISANGLLSTSCLMEAEDTKWIITSSIYYYFFAKVTELLDTVFFVLRKKYNQVTFLHIYHHSLMMWGTWITLKYEPSYGTIFLGTINSFVHIIMYIYYTLSTFPNLAKYLWWKKYITVMQLLQFMCIILQTAAGHFFSGCSPSYIQLLTILVNAVLFIYLFGKFYFKSYVDRHLQLDKKNSPPNGRNESINYKGD